jgi:hypothetical protein
MSVKYFQRFCNLADSLFQNIGIIFQKVMKEQVGDIKMASYPEEPSSWESSTLTHYSIHTIHKARMQNTEELLLRRLA